MDREQQDIGFSYGCYETQIKLYIESLYVGYSVENDNGVYCCPVDCTPYILCDVYRFADYLEYIIRTIETDNPEDDVTLCCVNIEASERTEAAVYKYLEAIGIDFPTECTPNDFNIACERLRLTIGDTYYNYLLNTFGIFEHSTLHPGYSQLTVLLNYLDTLGVNQLEYFSILYQILRQGIVMWCEDGLVKFQSVLSYIESQIGIGGEKIKQLSDRNTDRLF